MNKRQYKKKMKKIENYIRENFDFLDENYNYRTIPIRCHCCEYFESGDPTVGLTDGCLTPNLYDENDEIIEKVNDKVAYFMELLGYGCPFFKNRFKQH